VILEGVGLVEVEFGPEVDTYAGASGEGNARRFGTYGYAFRGHKP